MTQLRTLTEQRLAWALARAARTIRGEVESLIESCSDEDGEIPDADRKAECDAAVAELQDYILLLKGVGVDIDDGERIEALGRGFLTRARPLMLGDLETGRMRPAKTVDADYWMGWT